MQIGVNITQVSASDTPLVACTTQPPASATQRAAFNMLQGAYVVSLAACVTQLDA
jgi:hypothetical protein